MKVSKLYILYGVLFNTIFFTESSIAERAVIVDDAFYTSVIVKNKPVDREQVTTCLKRMCDGKESCQVYLKAFDEFSKQHPNMDLHVSYHCEDNGEKAESRDKTAKSSIGLIVLGCPPIQSPTLWNSVTSFAGSLLKSLSSSNSRPAATPAEAAPLMGGKHKKED